MPDEFAGGTVTPVYLPFNAFGYLNVKARGADLANFDSYSQAVKLKIIKYSFWQNLDGMNYGDGFPEAWDTQPDEFYYNFGKYSGKFVFDQDGNIHSIPAQNFRISKTTSTIGGITKIVKFIVTTDEGFKYTFGNDNLSAVEESKLVTTSLKSNFQYFHQLNYYQTNGLLTYLYHRRPLLNVKVSGGKLVKDLFSVNGNSGVTTYHYFTSSWYLSEISSVNGDKINFSYNDTGEISYISGKTHSFSLPNLSEIFFDSNASHPGWFFISPTPPISNPGQVEKIFPALQTFTFAVNEVFLKGKRLSSISTSNGATAYFDAITDRPDLYRDKRLDKIRIVNNGTTIKTFEFLYDLGISSVFIDKFNLDPYTTDTYYLDTDYDFINEKYKKVATDYPDQNAYVNMYSNIFSGEHYRMYLRELKEYGINNEYASAYSFEYYSPEKLPRRFSYNQDAWGFLNNNNRGTTIPKVTYTGSGGDNVPRSTLPIYGWDSYVSPEAAEQGAVLTPSLDLAISGSLKSITYPTQGYKEFLYELNATTLGAAGGLRVKEIKSYPSVLNKSAYIQENYSYATGKEVRGRIYRYDLPITTYENMTLSWKNASKNRSAV